MIDIYKKIPKKYIGEYLGQMKTLISTRIKLYCALVVSVYFLTWMGGLLTRPNSFSRLEVIIGLVLVAVSGLIIFLTGKAKTIFASKVCAFAFIVLLVVFIVKVSIVYEDNPLLIASTFVFSLFLISITIPWRGIEVIPIFAVHLAGFFITFLKIKYMPSTPEELFDINHFFEGALFLTTAFLICLVVRKNETERDVDNFVLLKEVEEKSEQMEDELKLAKQIHKTIIPDSESTELVDIAVTYLPVYYIGGDYTKFNFLENDKLIFIITDVTGHGVPAALLVNRIHSEYERLAKDGSSPGELLKELNEFIEEDFGSSGMYLSAFCGLLDLKKMTLTYSNYGHPDQLLLRTGDKGIEEMKSQAPLLGISSVDQTIYEETINVEDGDRILLFTDGVTETFGKAEEEYGEERVEDFLKANRGLVPVKFNESLMKALSMFKEGAFRDDICIVTIGIKAHPGLFHFGDTVLHNR